MTPRLLRCAIEEVADWHPHLYVEPCVVAFVAVAGRYSASPAPFDVECGNIASRWLGKSTECRLEVFWQDETAEKAARLRATMQASPLVELAAVALALILGNRVVPLGRLFVTDRGDRADYHARKRKAVLEVSGTEVPAELGRRHREKVAQAQDNPFGSEAYCGRAAPSQRKGTASASHDILLRRPGMAKTKTERILTLVEELMAESSFVLSKAQAFQTMGLKEAAQTLWLSAASLQERIAPLLDADGDVLEAAVYRMSAASCYEKAGDPSRAVNLYRAALAGPLREVTRKEVEGMLAACLARLKAALSSRKSRRVVPAS